MSMLAIGVTGLNAAQKGLLTTEHNITNVNTEGYNRQRAIQTTNIPMLSGSGFVGQGTQVETVRRMYNQFISGQVMQSETKVNELEAFHDEIKLIDNMLADPESGLSPALQDFFDGLQQVSAEPSSLPARQSMVSSSESLVARFRSIQQRMDEQFQSINEQIGSRLGKINSMAEQIADMNNRVITSSAGTGHASNDLLDLRDKLIEELNREVRVQTVPERDGSLSVFIGTGQQLVVGTQSNTLTAAPSTADPERFGVFIVNGNAAQELPESLLSGGALGGLLRFRTETLEPAMNALGRVAASLATSFNAQHSLGQDLVGQVDGAPGFIGNYFQISSPKVVGNSLNPSVPAPQIDVQLQQPPPMVYNNGDFKVVYDDATARYSVYSLRFPAANSAGVFGNGTFDDLPSLLSGVKAITGQTIDLTGGHLASDLTTSDYRIEMDSSGSSFTVTRLSDNVRVLPPTNVGAVGLFGDTRQFFDGLSIDLTVAPAGGRFTIQASREVARNIAVSASISSDPRLVAAAMPVRSEVSANNTGNATIEVVGLSNGYTWPDVPALQLDYDGTTNQLSFSNIPVGLSPLNFEVSPYSAGGGAPLSLPGPVTYVPDSVITVGGISIKISGLPKNGDVFTVGRNINGVADSRNMLRLSKLQTQDTMAGGKVSYQGAYGQLVGDIGNKTRDIEVSAGAQRSLQEQAVAARDAETGVNLDEEAANLIRYQQAYQAAARVIDVGSRLFDALISIGQ